MISSRLAASARAAGIHLCISATVVLAFALLVFAIWYPPPFDRIVAGRELILVLFAVDVICGPALTFVVFSPQKARRDLKLDLTFIVALQLLAFSYGIYSILQARPVWLAFEGDRYRVVRKADVDLSELKEASPGMREFSLTGPKAIGVRLIRGDEPGFLRSIELSVQGVHPSFRPERWLAYSTQRDQVIAAARPLAKLYEIRPEYQPILNRAVQAAGVGIENLGYFPLAASSPSAWIVLIDVGTAEPKAYAEVDAW